MIPIRDSIRSDTFPVVNVIIIGLNVLFFVFQLGLNNQELISFVYNYGLVPRKLTGAFLTGNLTLGSLIPLFTTMFLHGGWVHLLGNMLFLWVFGDNIEDRLGRLRYFLFYLLVGLSASVIQVLANPLAKQPIIGASGAVAGILGAYLILFPGSKIITLLPILFFFTFIEIPALIFLPLWFLIQTFNGFASIGAGANTVAWWAHMGGFVAGMALIKIFPAKISNKV